MTEPLLRVVDLKTYYKTSAGLVRAVDGVSFEVYEDETFCVVGESGCGKSTLALSIIRLVPYPGEIVDGKIIYRGIDLLKLPESEMRKIRGKEIAMIFQNPMNSLNPVFTIGFQIAEAPIIHFNMDSKRAWRKAIELITKVRMSDPEVRARNYPHELSGGMRQRAMIAMMISCEPKLLLADEPTTSVDVTVQAQLLKLLMDIKRERRMSIILITHNFGLVAEVCNRVAVMYAGKIVELGPVREVFRNPMHPYTRGLMKCLPIGTKRKRQLYAIPGQPPNLTNPPPGCRFHPRCPYTMEKCRKEEPPLTKVGPNHYVACHLHR